MGQAQAFFTPQRAARKQAQKQSATAVFANDHRCAHRVSTGLSTAPPDNSFPDERSLRALQFYDTVIRPDDGKVNSAPPAIATIRSFASRSNSASPVRRPNAGRIARRAPRTKQGSRADCSPLP